MFCELTTVQCGVCGHCLTMRSLDNVPGKFALMCSNPRCRPTKHETTGKPRLYEIPRVVLQEIKDALVEAQGAGDPVDARPIDGDPASPTHAR